MFFLAWREMMYSKLRYSLIGFIILLISFLILMVSGLAKGLSMDNAASILKTDANYFYVEAEAEGNISRSRIELEQLKQFNNEQYSAVRMGMATVENEANKKDDVTVFGIEGSVIEPVVVEGKSFKEVKGNEIIASEKLKQEGFELGDTLKVNDGEKTMTIAGFTDFQSFSHTPVLFIPFDEWNERMPAMGKPAEYANTVFLKMNESEANTLEKSNNKIDVLTKNELLKGLPSYSQEQLSLNMMVAFLYVIGAFVLSVFFYVITLQKRSQFGVLKAIGSTTTFLSVNIIAQVLLLTIISIAIASFATVGVASILPSDLPFYLPVEMMLQSAGLLIIVAIIGACVSLFSVVKVDALEAIGKVD